MWVKFSRDYEFQKTHSVRQGVGEGLVKFKAALYYVEAIEIQLSCDTIYLAWTILSQSTEKITSADSIERDQEDLLGGMNGKVLFHLAALHQL